jgi:two-component system NtrC family sensor kinase
VTPDPDRSPLAIIRDVARTLNRDLEPDATLHAVAGTIRHGLGVRRATIWRRAPSGTRLIAVSEPEAGLPAEAESIETLMAAQPGSTRVPLVHAGHRLGVLELEPGLATDGDLLAVLADVLAPYLDAVLLSEDLAAEVATRARELQEQRRFISLIIDTLPVGLHVVDRDYRIQIWNRKRETGTQGMRRDQVMGRRVFEVLTRQPAEDMRREYDQVFETGEVSQREQEVVAGGDRRVFRLTRIPMRLGGEVITHVITIGEDVTERRVAAGRLLQSEKLAAVGQLAAGVMHEINNPLATIGACVAAIEGRLGPSVESGVREYLDIIEAEVHRCTRIVDQLLDFSRSRPDRAEPVATDLNALLEQTLLLLKHHQRFKRLTVERELAGDLPRVLVDPERVIQAFMAIMLNAADAMERGGTLRVRTQRHSGQPDEVVAELADTGVGIPADDLAKIFEPFFTTKPAGRGTGLGLAICYGIVEEQGGRVGVESHPGLGTTFRVYLPVAPEEKA